MYNQYTYCLYFSELEMSSPEEFKRLKDIVSSLPSLPAYIPPDFEGKSWPNFFTEMLKRVISTLDDGNMMRILQKEEGHNVSLFYLYHI